MNITVEKIKALIDDTGCEESEAKTALELAEGNFNKAVSYVSAMLKYITAYKAKIMIKNENIFGLIHIITNNKNLDLLRFSIVMTYNPAIYEQNIEIDWFSFEKQIYSDRLVEGVMEKYTKSIETKLKEFVSVNLKDNKIINLKDMKTVLDSFFAEHNIVLELVAEELTLRDFKKLPKYFPESIPKETISSDYSSIIDLKAVIFEDALGKKIENIVPGDIVLAKIVDTRDIAHYIGHLIGAKKEDTMIPMPVEILSVEEAGGEYIVYLKYSELILGVSYVQRGSTLRVVEAKDSPVLHTNNVFVSRFSKQEEDKS